MTSVSHVRQFFTWKNFTVVLLAVIVVVPIIVGWRAGRDMAGAVHEVTSIQEISRLTTLRFPPTAALLEGKKRTGLQAFCVGKITFSATEVQHFLAQESLKGFTTSNSEQEVDRFRDQVQKITENKMSIQTTKKAVVLSSVVANKVGYLSVLFEQSSPTVTVYVLWFS